MKKRVLSILLAALLIIGVMPLNVFADTVTSFPVMETPTVVDLVEDETAEEVIAVQLLEERNLVYGVAAMSLGDEVVASVGEAAYTTLAEAVAAVNANGGTLKLEANIHSDDCFTFTNTVVLDLNGYTLTGNDGTSYSNLLSVAEGGILTVQDSVGTGKVDCYSYTDGTSLYYRYAISVKGVLNVVSGTVSGGSAISVNGGTAHITGGSVTGTSTGVYVNNSGTVTLTDGNVQATRFVSGSTSVGRAILADGGTVKINGGSVTGPSTGVWIKNSGTVTMTGGAVSGGYYYGVVLYDTGCSLDVSGGSITATGTARGMSLANNGGSIKISGTADITSAVYALYQWSGTVEMTGGSISGDYNTLQIGCGTVKVTGGKVISNVQQATVPAISLWGSTDPAAVNYTTVTIGADVEVTQVVGGYTLGIFNKDGGVCYGLTVDWDGVANGPFSVNGQVTNTENPAVINIGSSAKITSNSAIIYAAGYAVWNLEGCQMQGTTGIVAKAGEINVIGGTEITATGEANVPAEIQAGGYNESGSVMQLESMNGYTGAIVLNIKPDETGAAPILTSQNACVIYGVTDGVDTDNITTVSILGGTFTGNSNYGALYSIGNGLTTQNTALTGGKYSGDPAAVTVADSDSVDLVSEGYTSVLNETDSYYYILKNETAADEPIVVTYGDAPIAVSNPTSDQDRFIRTTDASVAAIGEDGTATIVGAGTADLTQIRYDFANATATTGIVKLTVNKAAGALSFVQSAYTLTVSEGYTFANEASVAAGNGTITYQSDRTDVVTVDVQSGVVTVVGAGTATVTASMQESDNHTAATASYTVTITLNEASDTNTSGSASVEGEAAVELEIAQDAADQLADAAETIATTLVDGNGTAGNTVSLVEGDIATVASAAEVNETVHAELSVTVSDAQSVSDVEQIERAVATLEGESVATFDIDVTLTVTRYDTDGNSEATATADVTKLSRPVPITVTLENRDMTGKSARVLYVHDGITKTIYPSNVVQDGNDIKVTFYASEFSTYAVVLTTQVNTPSTPIIYRNECFATTTGEFKDVAYFGTEAKPGDIVTLKISTSELGDQYGLDYKKITVVYETEGMVQLGATYDYNNDPIYKDGMATDFVLSEGLNTAVAHIYYNGFDAGTCDIFYAYVD